jgi:hypothetical protein
VRAKAAALPAPDSRHGSSSASHPQTRRERLRSSTSFSGIDLQAFRHDNTRKRCTDELSVLVILGIVLLLFGSRDANQSLT